MPVDLSPSPDREGRVNAWIEREDGFVLMVRVRRGGWTLPGGGIMPGENTAAAALREAWEESGAHVEATGEAFLLDDVWGWCVPCALNALDPSPEGRPVAWVNPHSLPWAEDVQIRLVLAARGETPAHLQVPPLVAQAREKARELGFDRSCSLETGRLLRVLATSKPGGKLLELGSGVGVGSAWLLAGMHPDATLNTVEHDRDRAQFTAELLSSDDRAKVLHGDWTEALERGPFDLMFSDCAPAKQETAHLDALIDALRVGGVLVVDNFSPPMLLPERLHAGDPQRDALFSHPRLSCTEFQVSRRECVLLATRTQ